MLFMILRGFVQAKALNSGVLPMIVHPAPRCSRHCFYFLEAVIAFDPIVHSSRGGGGIPLYGLYRYVRPRRVGSFSRFSHK